MGLVFEHGNGVVDHQCGFGMGLEVQGAVDLDRDSDDGDEPDEG